MAKSSIKPFELLVQYEQLSLKHKVRSEQTQDKSAWSGVGFKIDEFNYALAIDQIVEVIILTETTKIPGISSWVLGLGNIRGNLIPVIDMKSYLLNKPTKTTAHTRMVVINQIRGQVGLVVDEVFGQKHFSTEQKCEVPNDNDSAYNYVENAFMEEEEVWNILDVEKLINDPSFQNASAI